MRLIDADELMEKYHKTPVWDSWVEINNAPTIDAVPVVRCKDCKHEISTADIRARTGSYWCNYKLQPCDADDFCSYGKRKEEQP